MLITIFTVINFVQIVSSLEISIDAPESVEIGERFIVSIDAETTDTYDVKIFIHNSEDEKISQSEYISEIYGGKWQSSWNYVPEIFPKEKEFKLIVLESPGDREICVKLRKTSTGTASQTKCVKLEVLSSSKQKEINSELVSEEQEVKIEEEKSTVVNLDSFSVKSEKISLNQQEKDKIEVTTKKSKSRDWIIYSLISFLVILVVLLTIRKL